MNLKETIRTVHHWPKDGILFRDITTLLQDPRAYRFACDSLIERYKDIRFDKVAGIDARGFIFGSVLAYHLNAGFVPVRKTGKLPHDTVSEKYELEYGHAELELHTDAIQPGDRVLIVDDLLATGGTAEAAAKLVDRLDGDIVGCTFVIELPDLAGRSRLNGYDVFSLICFEGF